MGRAGRAGRATGAVQRAGLQRSAPPAKDKLQQLKELGDLKAQGVLTEQEFAAEKAKILAG